MYVVVIKVSDDVFFLYFITKRTSWQQCNATKLATKTEKLQTN